MTAGDYATAANPTYPQIAIPPDPPDRSCDLSGSLGGEALRYAWLHATPPRRASHSGVPFRRRSGVPIACRLTGVVSELLCLRFFQWLASISQPLQPISFRFQLCPRPRILGSEFDLQGLTRAVGSSFEPVRLSNCQLYPHRRASLAAKYADAIYIRCSLLFSGLQRIIELIESRVPSRTPARLQGHCSPPSQNLHEN